MRNLALLCLLSLFLGFLAPQAAHATIFSQVHGVVHDPQHRPIAGAHIELHAANSAFFFFNVLATSSHVTGVETVGWSFARSE